MKNIEQEKQAYQLMHLVQSGIELKRRHCLTFKRCTKLENKKKRKHIFDKIATSVILNSYKNHSLNTKCIYQHSENTNPSVFTEASV